MAVKAKQTVIRRMTRKDKSAKYVVKSASITKKQYNSKTQKQTTTKQQYRFVEEKK